MIRTAPAKPGHSRAARIESGKKLYGNIERSRAYKQLWRVVDGAVFDALYTHDDYLTEKGKRSARLSVVKRVTGAVLGYAEQSAQGRSGASSAARRGNQAIERLTPRTVFSLAVSKARAGAQDLARAWRAVWQRAARLQFWRAQ